MWVSWQQLGNRVTYSVIGPSVGKVEIMRGLSFYFLPSLDFMAGYQVLISSSAAWCFEAHIANSNPANWVEAPNHLDNDPSRSFLKRKTVSWYYQVGPGSSWSFLLIWFSIGQFHQQRNPAHFFNSLGNWSKGIRGNRAWRLAFSGRGRQVRGGSEAN